MADQQKTNMEQMALALYYHAAQMIKEGRSQDEIVQQLMKQGLSYDSAKTIITRLAESQVNVTRRLGYRNIAFGVLLIVMALLPLLGIFVTQVSGLASLASMIVLGSGLYAFGRGVLQISSR